MNKIIQWLEEHMIPCAYKHFLGIECPGCGIQRSAIELLKGNITESFIAYPPLIPVLCLLFYFVLNLILKFKNGKRVIKILAIINMVIIFTNYFYKLFFY